MRIERCGELPREEADRASAGQGTTKRHGCLPSWRGQMGRHAPSLMVLTTLHATIDVAGWLAAIAVVPAMVVPFVGPSAWTPESLFLIVAITVQVVSGQAGVLKMDDDPDFFGLGRWVTATVVAAAVTGFAFAGRPVAWDLLGAGALLALLARAGADDAVLAARHALYHRRPSLGATSPAATSSGVRPPDQAYRPLSAGRLIPAPAALGRGSQLVSAARN